MEKKRLTLKEIQRIEFGILCEFASLCEVNNLNYGLTSGTLLGAIRHGGFIPWDDDIDIVMPREDYNKFIRIFMKQTNKKFDLETPYDNSEYIYEYIKMIDVSTVMIEMPKTKKIKTHVYVDIFPVDGLPQHQFHQKLHLLHVKYYQFLFALLKRAKYKVREDNCKFKVIWKLLNKLNQILPPFFLISQLDRILQKYSYEDSLYVGVKTGQWMKEILRKEDYKLDGWISFEGVQFHTYKNPELYLHSLYGNFMVLPPAEKRISHDNIAWRI